MESISRENHLKSTLIKRLLTEVLSLWYMDLFLFKFSIAHFVTCTGALPLGSDFCYNKFSLAICLIKIVLVTIWLIMPVLRLNCLFEKWVFLDWDFWK